MLGNVAHWYDGVPRVGDVAPCGYVFPIGPNGNALPIQPNALKCAVCVEIVEAELPQRPREMVQV
jgi:hypothetical protein